jgi:hypothetical protein
VVSRQSPCACAIIAVNAQQGDQRSMAFDVYPKTRIMPGGRTEILLSFGGRDAFQFAAWLRLALLKIRHESHANYVYLDTYGLLDLDGSALSLTVMRADSHVDRNAVTIDLKTGTHTGGSLSGSGIRGGVVSTLNAAWNARYEQAMDEASGMIFIITKAWNDSENCRQEFDQCLQRCGAGLTPVVLTFQDLPDEKARFESFIKNKPAFTKSAQFITAQRNYAVADPAKRLPLSPTMRDLFTIGEPVLRRLADAAKIKRD